MNFLICPDSFKGSITSSDAGKVIEKALHDKYNDCQTQRIVVADGGEGSIDAYAAAMDAEIFSSHVLDMHGRLKTAEFAVKGDTAVIEVAQTDYPDPKSGVLTATSRGVGMQIRLALDKNVGRIVLCLGGSGTTDAGLGMAEALGAVFTDRDGRHVSPDATGLGDLAVIDFSGLDRRLSHTELIVASDVTNPLYGRNGAAYIFAPQKGADAGQVRYLDAGLRRFADCVKKSLKKDVSSIEGAGAAGGIGAMAWLLGGERISGIDFFLNIAGFDSKLAKADVILTGEGRADGQSVCGKAVGGILRRAANKPVVCFCGCLGAGWEKLIDAGVSGIYAITPQDQPIGEALKNANKNLYDAVMRYETT